MSDRRDYVQETYDAFIKDAQDIEPTDPVKAVEMYFAAHASDDLKARCKTEGKTAKTCWEFIEAVARKIGSQCHIDPAVVYAMCMHYFEDVPVDWNLKVRAEEVKAEMEEAKLEPKKPEPKPKKAKRIEQGFFFDILESSESEVVK